VNFDSAELPSVLGMTSAKITQSLGEEFAKEVIHRDDLVLISEN
jgi:glutamate 5-kinase